MVSAPSQAKTINVPGDYQSIQDAINHSARGDTVTVNSGTYRENIVIDRAVTMLGQDTGAGMPVVDGLGKNGITITSGSVTLKGFRVTNANHGIKIDTTNANSNSMINVIGNTVSDCGYGITGSGFFNVAGNTVSNNKASGIHISTSGAEVTGNIANGNGDNGFYLHGCYNVNIKDNTANNNGLYGLMITGPWCHDNLLTGNKAEHNQHGIGVSECTNVTLRSNTAGNNTFAGIYLLNDACNNVVTGNTANHNGYVGICFDNTENILNNVVTGNTVYDNPKGGVCIQPYSSYGYELNGPQYSTDFSRGGNVVGDNNADSPGPVNPSAAGTMPPGTGATAQTTGQSTPSPGISPTGSGSSCCAALLLSLIPIGTATIGLSRRKK